MDEGRSKALLALCWLWVVAIGGYMVWGAMEDVGLYHWLAELQIEQWGGHSPKATAVVPGLLLTAPAFWFIRRRRAIVHAREGEGPAAEARRTGRTARLTALAGVAAGLIGGGAFLLSQRVPDGSEEATRFDAATLGSVATPDFKVRIAGRVDPEASGMVNDTGAAAGRDRVIYYAGFRPEGTAKDAPLRLFVERTSGTRESLTTVQAFLPEQTGYLFENGVPQRGLRDLEARGIRVARPHYLLKTGSLARREPYYIIAALGGAFFVICLLVAMIGAFQARSRSRLAKALEASRQAGYR